MSSEGTYRCFSLQEILRTTNNFEEESVIGIGGFGKVYLGFCDNGARVLAIKRLNTESKQGAGEFWTEVKMLSKLRHANLVGLIGYCNESQEFILVYEYIARGTLASHLYERSKTGFSPLSWEQRLDICTGAARGLDYLHSGTSQSYIHRDVKTTNILIDENWVAKVSDFGLSKASSHSITHISTNVKGTFGYLDPDYFITQRLTRFSDVYAFGVVLLEVLCGRPPVDRKLDEEQISLVHWAQGCIKRGKLAEVIDFSLSGQIAPNCLKSFVALANNCLQQSPKSRPTMAEVSGRLQLASLSQRRRTEGIMTKALQSVRDIWLRERKDNSSSSGHSKDSPLESNPITGTQLYRQFSFANIRVATRDFNKSFLVRNSDKVYKSSLNIDGKHVTVAIKRINKLEAVGEVIHPKNLLSHPNILSPIGFCTHGDELIIVHDYMAHGSLQDHLYGEFARLPWEQRLEICIGAAQGLEHLHGKGDREVIHCLIEPSCILLDENLVAKVLLTNIRSTTNNTKHPLFARPYDSLSKEDDLYSFGVTLLEVLTGNEHLHVYRHPKFRNALLLRSLKATLRSNIYYIHKVMDSHLRLGNIEQESLRYFAHKTLSCLSDEGMRKIDSVVMGLQFALEKQKSPQGFITTAEPPIQAISSNPGQ